MKYALNLAEDGMVLAAAKKGVLTEDQAADILEE